jgi:GTP 3',8-cyclase
MPAEGLPWLERAEILTFEEIARLVSLFGELGVHDVRLTGGEPLVRKQFAHLAQMLARIDTVHDLSVTTNGFLLERDAEALVRAGINRFNVSVDSLQRDRFFELTRRNALPQVLRGLEHLATFPEAHPIKINAVAMRGFTEDEVIPLAEFARATPYEVRFIEFMPLDADHAWDEDQVLTGAEIRDAIDAVYPLEAQPREPHATARVYRFADGNGKIGFINPVSEPFCADCNRVRLTADGHLRTCLFSMNETDLRSPMRDGADDRELEQIIRDAVWLKELKHHVGEPGFIQPARTMSAIGG